MSETPGQDIRVGDAEREEALKALGEHLSAGRLDIDEYGERSARVTAARTRRDLVALFDDLPAPHPTFGGPPAATESAPLAGTGPEQPAAPPARRSGTQLRQAISGVIALSWVAAIATIVLVSGSWPVIFIPIALSMVAGSIWGKNWNRGHEMHREAVEESRDRHRDAIEAHEARLDAIDEARERRYEARARQRARRGRRWEDRGY